MIPGYTDGPPVQFLKVTNRLSKKSILRDYPRIVDVQKFTKEKKLTMADIVATVHYKHDLETLNRLLDLQDGFTFSFV